MISVFPSETYSLSQRRIIDVSRPPEYARTIFIAGDEPPVRRPYCIGAPNPSVTAILRVLPSGIPQSVAEGDIHITCGLHHFAVGRNELEPIDSFRDRYVTHLIILITDH